MKANLVQHTLGMTYLPNSGDPVAIRIPELSHNPICTFVRGRTGSYRNGKVVLYCPTGPGDTQGNIQLIWKPSTGWFCWMLGKKYSTVQVDRD
jgi:hypothetical protein